MKKEEIKSEIEMCNGILIKLKEELLDCKKDYDFLKEHK